MNEPEGQGQEPPPTQSGAAQGFEAHPGHGEGYGGLDVPRRGERRGERHPREGAQVSDGERGEGEKQLFLRGNAASGGSREQEAEQEGQVIGAREDVLDARAEEPKQARRR
ncbi:MAG TPA: hypothetical protein VF316_09960, partial [Polyangiaceae bacterium]